MTNPEQELRDTGGARAFGKTIKLIQEFFERGRQGESVMYGTPEGNFLSPKAVENLLLSEKQRVARMFREWVVETMSHYRKESQRHLDQDRVMLAYDFDSRYIALKHLNDNWSQNEELKGLLEESATDINVGTKSNEDFESVFANDNSIIG